jgi:hypothetical protein
MTFPACVLLTTTLLAARIDGKPAVHLADGKFGKALDASVTPLAFGGDERYRTPPLTVECWAKLNSKRDFNVLVSCDPKASSRHWEIYSYAGRGTLSAYLPGYAPSEVISRANICDGKWHHVAMTFDGATVALFTDGKKVREQKVTTRPGAKPLAGPLSVGQAIDGGNHIGCDGLVDEVHLSRVIRKIDGMPAAPPAVDADTIGLWRFDEGEAILADPAWTPPPETTGEPWERATDVDWVDGRLRQMDTGPTFNATMRYQHGWRPVTVYKGTAIRIGDKGEGGVIFDRNQLGLAAGWTGGWLNHSDRRFGLLNTPTPAGRMLTSTASGPGWAGPTGKYPPTAPLPHAWGRYKGLYLHGNRAVLSYLVEGVEVLESPWMETVGGQTVLTRTGEVGPCEKTLNLPLGRPLGMQKPEGRAASSLVLATTADGNQQFLQLTPSVHTRRFRVIYGAEIKGDREAVLGELGKRSPLPDLKAWTKPGPGRYPTPLVTKGEVAKDDAPYVVDTLTIPYDNPHRALFFCTGHDFLPDGRVAVCTAHGDVWLAKFDDKLERIEWRRFATGLYQPLGLKVIDGKVVVLERGQLTRLHDTNGDSEADFYENLCHDWHTGSGEHSYDTCLETDAAGNFYFFKTGDTELPHGGCLLQVSKDGKKVEIFATGFRHPIGLGVSPTELVTGADQEGNWMPMTRVDVYKRGGFYGDMRAHHRAVAPKIYDGPLVWLPKDVDNSAGGQAWVPHDRFGLPKGQMLHLSYGRCKLYALLTQQIDDVWQAGAVDLGVRFLSGSARGRFHPADGHLYVTGLNGWQTAAKRDGCLQRVRYTGKPLPMPVGLRVQTDGIRIDFARPLAKSAAEKRRYRVEQCNIRWSADYGSKRWSVRDPGRQGQDVVEVDAATLSEDGKSVFLRIKDLKPVMMMRIGYDVQAADGERLSGAIHNTIHRLEGSH